MAATAVITTKWDDTKRVHILASLALTGNYSTGGISLDLLTALTDTRPGFVALPGIGGQPILARFEGIAGYKYEYDYTNKKLIIRQVAAQTPAGTNAASTVTGNVVVKGGGIGEAIGINPDTNAGVLSKGAATDRTIPVATFLGGALTAPAQTFTGTAQAAGPMVELPASALPAGVTGDTIQIYAIFRIGN
jgi:hypothetical protein